MSSPRRRTAPLPINSGNRTFNLHPTIAFTPAANVGLRMGYSLPTFRLLRKERDASGEARAGVQVAGGGRSIPGKLGLTLDNISQGGIAGVIGTVWA